MIPLELLTMGASGLLAGGMTILSKMVEAKSARHRDTMMALGKAQEGWQQAREVVSKGFSFTRRTIALTVVFSVVLLPKIVAMIWPEVSVTVGYTEWNPGFWPFIDGHSEVTWRVAKGFVLTPLDTHFTAAVIGLYFGHKISK